MNDMNDIKYELMKSLMLLEELYVFSRRTGKVVNTMPGAGDFIQERVEEHLKNHNHLVTKANGSK